MARGLRGVKDDLSEIARHIVDIACFLTPLIATTYADSPPSSPHPPNPKSPPPTPTTSSRVISSALNDLPEIGGGLRSGISRLSGLLRRPVAGKERDLGGGGGVGIELAGVREEVLGFVRDLIKCPESWVEFPVPVDDNFDTSRDQKEHIATVERLVPSLAALKISLCPSFMSDASFWKIYFALLHPKLNKHESELLSTQQIVEEMRMNLKKKKMDNRVNPDSKIPVAESSSSTSNKESDVQQEGRFSTGEIQEEDIEVHRVPLPTKSTYLKYIDRWFDRPAANREMDTSTYNRPQSSNKDESGAEDDSIVLLNKYASSSSVEALSLDNSPFSSYERLHLLDKSYSKGYHEKALPRSNNEEAVDEESSSWHAGEDSSDFEIVGRS